MRPRLDLFLSVAAAGALAGCASPKLTQHPHAPAAGCSVRADGAAIVCDGAVFATLECAPGYGGCQRLAVRYADGEVAQLYAGRGDPKFDKASHVATAPDGSRVWFIETEGPFLATRGREYDVGRGKLWDVSDVDSVAASAGAIPLRVDRAR